MPAHRLAVVDTRQAAARLLAAGRGAGLHTIALHFDTDRTSRWIRHADESISLGHGDLHDAARDGRLESALVAVEADLAWGAWGLGSDAALLAGACDRTGVDVVGPRGAVLARLLDPSVATSAASAAGLAVAAAGAPRALAVDVVADAAGAVWAAGARTCVAVPTGFVLYEESVPAREAAAIGDAACHLCRALGLVGAATVRFTDLGGDRFAFVDLVPWLEPGSAVTEAVTGADLFALTLGVALGEPLPDQRGGNGRRAVAAHLAAVDPEHGFSPTAGTIVRLEPPSGAGIRADVAVTEGDPVGAAAPAIATITAAGRTVDEARTRLAVTLADTVVLVARGTTNKVALIRLAGGAEPLADDGMTETAALLWAAVEAHDEKHRVERDRFFAAAARGRPGPAGESGHVVEFTIGQAPIRMRTYQLDANRYRVDTGSDVVDVEVEHFGPHEGRIRVRDRVYDLATSREGPVHAVEIAGHSHRFRRSDGGIVQSPGPAVIVSVLVEPGQVVAAGDAVAVIESMKMETAVRAPFSGRVKAVLVAGNTQVEAGAPIVQIEDAADDREFERTAAAFTFAFPPLASLTETTAYRCDALFDMVRSYALGYDLDPRTLASVVASQHAVCADVDAGDAELVRHEADVLGLFADLCAVSRRQPDADFRIAPQEHLFTLLRSLDLGPTEVPATFRSRLLRALSRYGVHDLEHTDELEASLFRLYRAQHRLDRLVPIVVGVLDRCLDERPRLTRVLGADFNGLLDRVIAAADGRYPTVADLAREVRFRYFEEPALDRIRDREYARVEGHIDALTNSPYANDRAARIAALVQCPQPMRFRLLEWFRAADDDAVRGTALEAGLRRYYRIRTLRDVHVVTVHGRPLAIAEYDHEGHVVHLVFTHAAAPELDAVLQATASHLADVAPDRRVVLDVQLWQDGPLGPVDDEAASLRERLEVVATAHRLHRIDLTLTTDARPPDEFPDKYTYHFTFRPNHDHDVLAEDTLYRNLHPMLGKRLEIELLRNFHIDRLGSVEDVYLFRGVAEGNPKDERLFALAEVRDLTPVMSDEGEVVALPLLERMLTESLSAIRHAQSHRPAGERLMGNLVVLFVRPLWEVPISVWRDIALRLAPATRGLGIDRVVAHVRIPDPVSGTIEELAIDVSNPGRRGVVVRQRRSIPVPEPMTAYEMKVRQTERRGAVYPYELIRMITPTEGGETFPAGTFTEYDLDAASALVPVDRPYGANTANLVVGTVTNVTATHPEGMTRVVLLGDPSRSLGSLAEPECRRIIAALDLAERLGVPAEWYALSAGALISMDSGTENMDWISAVLRRIIEFTQHGHELNVVVTGINVGAQPYWNAEATMLMHTRGILVMTPESAMVLTGKQALDYSGGVSAEDNLGIGGYERVMGPNGQGQYWAPDLEAACDILFRHYDHTYVAPGERFPRRVPTIDPFDRDVCDYPHAEIEGVDFRTVGDVFSSTSNPERKKPFDIRSVMRATTDQDHAVLERWQRWSNAETSVVWDAHIGGIPVCLLGIESRGVARQRFVPADGPAAWTSGTLFPQSSKKTARAVNAASGNRPLVVLANLSGFDGSPESMRELQLEYGAEIGRAVVNFRGPIVFCVVSRYHGGAFVVFSKRLNEDMEIAAVEGSFASVIGGAPAAAVVFTREVDARTRADTRIADLDDAIAHAEPSEQKHLRQQRDAAWRVVRSEKLGEVAEEFERIHNIERAQRVGSVDHIIPANRLRPYLIEALERRMARAAGAAATAAGSPR